jgi:hypothetical protein
MDRLWDAIPDPAGPRWLILQSIRPTHLIEVIPAIEGRSAHADPVQGLASRQMRLFDQLDDLSFLSGWISHSSSPPSAIMLFQAG